MTISTVGSREEDQSAALLCPREHALLWALVGMTLASLRRSSTPGLSNAPWYSQQA